MTEEEKFTRHVTKSDYTPKDGSEPLTVIEFSLTNEVRDSLEEALKPYVTGDQKSLQRDKGKRKAYLDAIAPIIKTHMPKEILDEIERITEQGGPKENVYVIHNLPTSKDIPIDRSSSEGKKLLGEWQNNGTSFNRCLMDGISDAIGAFRRRDRDFELFRFGGDEKQREEPTGSAIHKHANGELGMMMGGHLDPNTQSPTVFTDISSAIDDENMNDVQITLNRRDPRTGESTSGGYTAVQLREQPEILKGEQSTSLSFAGRPSAAQKVLENYSQQVVVQPGTVVLWSHEGKLFHKAVNDMPESKMVDDKAYRVIFVNDLVNPKNYGINY